MGLRPKQIRHDVRCLFPERLMVRHHSSENAKRNICYVPGETPLTTIPGKVGHQIPDLLIRESVQKSFGHQRSLLLRHLLHLVFVQR